MNSKAAIFNISIESHEDKIKFLFYDDNTTVRVNSFDFTELDTTTNYKVDYTIIKKSTKLTNFQFKKALKRTMNKLLLESLTSYINALSE